MIGNLTKRQIEVLDLLRQGYKDQQIADILYIDKKSVQSHIMKIYQACDDIIGNRNPRVVVALTFSGVAQ